MPHNNRLILPNELFSELSAHDFKIKNTNQKILTYLLHDETAFNTFFNILKESSGGITLASAENSEQLLEYHRKNIYNMVIATKVTMTLSASEEGKLNQLMPYFQYKHFKNCKNNLTYDLFIEDQVYHVSVNKILEFLDKDQADLMAILSNDEITEIAFIPKKYFCYAVKQFFKEYDVLADYTLSGLVLNNFTLIKNDIYVDTKAINKILTTEDQSYKDVHLNAELEECIFNGLPEHFTTLEKAIFIYLKMCKLFVYDREFYAARQIGKVAEKHQDINYIAELSLENNAIVCWEFNAIFSYFLHKLSLNYVYRCSEEVKNYGDGHVGLRFRCDDLIIMADAVISVFQNDLLNAKLDRRLIGLKCLNTNHASLTLFVDSLTKVTNYLKELEEKTKNTDTLNSLLSEYRSYTEFLKPIAFEDKVEQVFSIIKGLKLSGMDMFAYIYEPLLRSIFSGEERNEKIKFAVIKNNKPLTVGKETMPVGVFCINNTGFMNSNNNHYFIFTEDKRVKEISKAELQELFNDGTLEYMDPERQDLPLIVSSFRTEEKRR